MNFFTIKNNKKYFSLSISDLKAIIRKDVLYFIETFFTQLNFRMDSQQYKDYSCHLFFSLKPLTVHVILDNYSHHDNSKGYIHINLLNIENHKSQQFKYHGVPSIDLLNSILESLRLLWS
jgi:hypothetical protein